MVLLYLVLLVAILVVNRYFFGMLIKPTDIFSVIWCTIAPLAQIGFYGYYPTSISTNVLIIIAVVSFNAAYIVAFCIKNKYKNNLDNLITKKDISSHVNFGLLYLGNAICWVVSIPVLENSLYILRIEGYRALRMYVYTYGEDAVIASTEVQLFFTWIVQPLFVATMAITIVSILLSLKNKFILLGISIIDMVLYALLFGGRGILVKFVSFFIISVIIVGGRYIFKVISKHKALLMLIIGIFLVLTVLTSLRSFSGASIFKNIYTYLAGPFVFLDQILQVYPVGTETLWGTATIGCIMSILGAIGKIFFGIDFNAPEHVITIYTAGNLDIGAGIGFNSMTTMVYPFLMDYGYFGVVLGPVIFGVFVAVIERLFRRERSLRAMCLFVYVFHTVIFSVQNYVYLKMEALTIILFIILFTTKVKIKNGSIYIS